MLAYIQYLLDAETIKVLSNSQWNKKREINTLSPSFLGGLHHSAGA